MFSDRFQLQVLITRHAQERMTARLIDEALLLDLIETGTVRYKDDAHLWIFKHYENRDDNLLCAAAVIQSALVVKTVLHRFEPDEPTS